MAPDTIALITAREEGIFTLAAPGLSGREKNGIKDGIKDGIMV